MDPDTSSKIDSRSSEAIPVKEMANPIDSTRRDLPHIFGLGGQTEAKLKLKIRGGASRQ